MPEKISQASFIPKKPIDQTSGSKVKRKKSTSLYMILAGVLFVAAIGLSVAAFLYKQVQDRIVVERREQLKIASEAFDRDIVSQLASLDTRMKTAEQIIDRHVALTPFFTLLESLTLETIQFDSFTFKRSSGSQYNILMTGEADSFNSIALQSDAMGASDSISSPLFTNFSLDEESGTVIFNLDIPVASNVFKYNPNL